jgi:hypothetical protein
MCNTVKEKENMLTARVREKETVWSMANSRYEGLFVKPVPPLTYREGARRHMTEWANILEKFPEEIAYYYFRRLRDLQIDSLTQGSIKIDDVAFPVYFRTNGEREGGTPLENNLHAMLVTTCYPAVPANLVGYIYHFSKVEEIVDLPWLKFEAGQGRRTLSYEEVVTDVPLLLQRNKITGVEFRKVKDISQNMVVGSFWQEMRFPYVQLEFVPDAQSFFCITPNIGHPSEEGLYSVLPHPHYPYTGVVPCDSEGIMVTVGDEEVRVKKENSAEIEIEGFGTVEVVERDKQLIPINLRPGKMETANPIPKMRGNITTNQLLQEMERKMIKQTGNVDRVELKDDIIIYQTKWDEKNGMEVDGVFYFYDDKKIKATKKFYQIDNNIARVSECYEVVSIPESKKMTMRYVALLAVDESSRMALELRYHGLYEMPHMYAEIGQDITVNQLFDRVYQGWENANYEGPYSCGNMEYYVHVLTKESVLPMKDLDVSQIHFGTVLCYYDYANKKSAHKLKKCRAVQEISCPHQFSKPVVAEHELIEKVAEAFNIPKHKKEKILCLGDGDKSYEIKVRENQALDEELVGKQSKPRKRYGRKGMQQPLIKVKYKSLLVYWHEGAMKFSEKVIEASSLEELDKMVRTLDYVGVMFPSSKEKKKYIGYLSVLAYFYLKTSQ